MDDLILKALQGTATREEQAELDAWRRSSRANEEQYRQLQRVWQLTGLLKWQDAPAPVPPADALLAGRRRRAGASWWQTAAAIAAAFIGITFAVTEFGDSNEFSVREIVTGPNETVTAELEDGTVVRLASSSRLRVASMKGGRNVALEGRAFFAVAKDTRRPFRVQAGAGEVTVLGTQFDLSARDQDLQLVVLEGAVQLSSGGRTVRVEAGEASQVTGNGGPEPLPVAAVEESLEWVGPLLVFQRTPLDQVARAIQLRFGQPVIVKDSILAERTVTAWFSTEEVWQVMSVVCRVVDAHCRTSGETIVIEQ